MSPTLILEQRPSLNIDMDIDIAQRVRPDCSPGQRMVAGKLYIFDADLLLSFNARESVRSAPADLSDLTRAELDWLISACMRRTADTMRQEPLAMELHERVLAEIMGRKSIPVLEPITTQVRSLDPSLYSDLSGECEASVRAVA